ncbi:MAG: flagellar protein FliT [Lachnospiraceae bacterium]|nr:flagellar protein FliT [Lachnospiraceae bacterium]
MQDKEYIAVLIQSLEKKKEILDKIIAKNKEQKILFTDEGSDPDRLEENMQEKSGLVDQLNELDEGFQQIYNRVKSVLQSDKESYKEEIRTMQKLITEVTEMSTTIQAQEKRNYDLAGKRFAKVKKGIRKARASNRVASQYYKNMANLNVVDSQYMDKKN